MIFPQKGHLYHKMLETPAACSTKGRNKHLHEEVELLLKVPPKVRNVSLVQKQTFNPSASFTFTFLSYLVHQLYLSLIQ